jgi:nucleotide-binding universal stress UspA family protein
MISTIAVGTDGSQTASQAVDVAAEMAERFDAKLVLMSAYGEAKSPRGDVDPELQWETNPAARMREILERTASKLGGRGIECTTPMRGSPGERSSSSRRNATPTCS